MIISGLRCTCGDTEVMAVWPGENAKQCDLFALTPYRSMKCWCQACWLRRFGKPALPRSGSRAGSGALTQD